MAFANGFISSSLQGYATTDANPRSVANCAVSSIYLRHRTDLCYISISRVCNSVSEPRSWHFVSPSNTSWMGSSSSHFDLAELHNRRCVTYFRRCAVSSIQRGSKTPEECGTHRIQVQSACYDFSILSTASSQSYARGSDSTTNSLAKSQPFLSSNLTTRYRGYCTNNRRANS